MFPLSGELFDPYSWYDPLVLAGK